MTNATSLSVPGIHPPVPAEFNLMQAESSARSVLLGFDFVTLGGLLSLYMAYCLGTAVYNVFFSPLSVIPGPWYAAISDTWLLFNAARLLQCDTLHSALRHYGPVVRVGPRRVVFCDHAAMKSVYCVRKMPKSVFYKALIADDHDHSMTSITNAEHTRRRKAFAAHYSLANVGQFQPDIQDRVSTLLEVIESSPRRSVDCIHLFRHLFVDILRTTLFGLDPLSLNAWKAGRQDWLCAAVRDFPIRALLRSCTPTFLWKILAYVRHERWQSIYHADKTLASFVRKRMSEMQNDEPEQDVELEASGSDRPAPLLRRMLAQRQSGLSEQDIVSECISHMVAGVDTSTATLGFIFWELSRRPDVVDRLRVELDEVMPERRSVPAYAVLARQPYLSAFLNEAFRLYGAVNSLLERVVPEQKDAGASPDLFDLMGYGLPPGTVVGTQAWSMHRDPDVFPSPNHFDPDRWLPLDPSKEEEERLARMQQHMMPFGAGTRACPGRYQAQIIFRTLIAAVVSNFDVVLDPSETNEETMAPRDAFAVRPASRECKVTFVPRP
ncbi:cytochrome P450 [Pilatotrama ljubarskyi]|nr:cytochrome P450 [Pilatotrama ljubarskyi]